MKILTIPVKSNSTEKLAAEWKINKYSQAHAVLEVPTEFQW